MTTDHGLLRVLVIDDERPALDELAFLLERDPRVGGVLTCDSATEALRMLQDLDVDAVFLDIQMPGLTGLDLAQVLARFRTPPPVVFVTAHEEHAVDAFELHAVDYVLKPVRERAPRRSRTPRGRGRRAAAGQRRRADPGRARWRHPVPRPVRHHPRGGARRLRPAAHRGRTPTCCGRRCPTLEEEWAPAGFVRIHRSLLVSLAHVRRGADGRRPVHGRGRRAPSWPSAAATPASCATC